MLRIAFFAALSLMAAMSPAFSKDVVRIGLAAEPYPPFSVKQPDGKWTGFEIDLQNAVCKKIDADCQIVELAYTGLIPALLDNKIDVIWSTMAVTEERKKTIDFGTRHLLTPKVMVAPKSSDINFDFDNPDSASGRLLGVQKATAWVPYLQKYLPTAELKQYDTQDDAIFDLRAGRVDAIGVDLVVIKEFLESADGADFEVKAEVKPDPILTSGSAVGYRKSDTALREKIDAALKELRADGTYQNIAKNYFEFDPYGK